MRNELHHPANSDMKDMENTILGHILDGVDPIDYLVRK
jgi:hypothetical protein